MDIQQFIEEFSADLRGQQNSLLLSLFIEKSEFKHIPDYFLPIRAELSGNKCIFSYTDKFISMEYGNQAHVMLMEIYRVLYRHPQREQSLIEDERDKMIAHISSWMTINQFVDINFTPVTDRTYADSISFEEWLEQGPDTHPHIKNPAGHAADLDSTFWAVIDILGDLEQDEQEQQQDQESDEESEPEKNQDYFNQSDNSEGDEDESDADSQEGSNEGQGESEQDQEQKEGEADSNESGNSQASPGQGNDDDGEQFYRELIQDAERHGETIKADHPVHGRSTGQTATDDVVQVQTRHSPSASRAWNRIVRWETQKRKKESMQFCESWAFRNPRMFSMSKKLALPYEKYTLDEKAPEFWVFLDVSQSCERLKPSFERILESIPKNFAVRPFVFAEYCVPYDMETKSYKNVGYGTEFYRIEQTIQQTITAEGIPYPKYVIVITDGHGGSVKPEHPERWMFIASEYGEYYSHSAYQTAYYKTKSWTGKHQMSTNCIAKSDSEFIRTLSKRKKHLPLFVSYLEFEENVTVEYVEGNKYTQA